MGRHFEPEMFVIEVIISTRFLQWLTALPINMKVDRGLTKDCPPNSMNPSRTISSKGLTTGTSDRRRMSSGILVEDAQILPESGWLC